MRKTFSIIALFLFTACTTTKVDYSANAFPRKYPDQERHSVVIDAGHGSFDLGASNCYVEEKELCLKTSLFLRKHLIERGYRVVMTRSRDEYITLKKRAEIANELRSQVFLSIHFNAAKNSKASGIEVYYSPKAESWRLKRSKMLAQSVLAKMLSRTRANSRGVKEGNFHVIRETKMPSILIECGFITNEDERKKLMDVRYLDSLAVSIADGLDDYFSK